MIAYLRITVGAVDRIGASRAIRGGLVMLVLAVVTLVNLGLGE